MRLLLHEFILVCNAIGDIGQFEAAQVNCQHIFFPLVAHLARNPFTQTFPTIVMLEGDVDCSHLFN